MKIFIHVCFVLLSFTASAQTYLGNYSRHVQEGGTVSVLADSSTVRFIFYTPEIVRVDVLPSRGAVLDSSFVVVRSPGTEILVSVRETDSVLVVSSSVLHITCSKYPLRLTFSDSTGRVLLAEPGSGGISWDHNARAVRFAIQERDHFYGTGERGTRLDKRGLQFESYNTQVPGYGTPLATMNINVPLITSTNGYALFIDNTYRGKFDLGASAPTMFSYTAAGGELSWYFIEAPTIPEQLEKYTWLTGRQPLPPRWALGFIQSKNRYEDEADAQSMVRTMREKQIPCDAIVLDLKWFEKMGDITWNEKSWPHHEAMITEFLSRGMKTILITEPYIIQPSVNFKAADTSGFLAKDSTGHTFLLDQWWSCGGTCSASLLDITNPGARQWWWSKHPASFGAHVAGIWTDLGEPERHPAGMIHWLGGAEKIHNIYDLLWAKTIFDGFSGLRPDERVVNLTRSGFAGIQRYGVLPWSGDVARSFGGLAVQLPMLLNMGMSGIAYHNSDIGGYSRMATTPELYVRWMQYGTFCPIARAHGAGETVHGYATEPWKFGDAAESICRDFIGLRYRLLPYIYTMAHDNYQTGLPLARPLFWQDASDTLLFNESASYMWGPAFLVSPVTEAGQSTKQLYLPRGTWINYWTDEIVNGGTTVSVAAPLERMPLFVKAGSIIPMASVMQYSDEHAMDTLTLHVYPGGSERTSYTLYEDDGTTLTYQAGAFAVTTFTQHHVTDEQIGNVLALTAGEARGAFKGKLQTRVYVFDVHGMMLAPTSVHCNGVDVVERRAGAFRTQSGNGFFYDEASKHLFITLVCQTDQSYAIDVRLPETIK
jgi:alpha-glucosidase (family GH31 glycosyl hydrolase)